MQKKKKKPTLFLFFLFCFSSFFLTSLISEREGWREMVPHSRHFFCTVILSSQCSCLDIFPHIVSALNFSVCLIKVTRFNDVLVWWLLSGMCITRRFYFTLMDSKHVRTPCRSIFPDEMLLMWKRVQEAGPPEERLISENSGHLHTSTGISVVFIYHLSLILLSGWACTLVAHQGRSLSG